MPIYIQYRNFTTFVNHLFCIITLTLLLDMAWPTKGSGTQYNSHTGFGNMVGCYCKKVIGSKVLSRLCRICENAKSAGLKAKKHKCVKNWDWNESSKKMEAAAILQMLVESPAERGIFISWIVSDNDSVMRAVCSHPNVTDKKQKVNCQSISHN